MQVADGLKFMNFRSSQCEAQSLVFTMPRLLLKSTAASKQGHGAESYAENTTSYSTRRGQGEMGTVAMNLGAAVG